MKQNSVKSNLINEVKFNNELKLIIYSIILFIIIFRYKLKNILWIKIKNYIKYIILNRNSKNYIIHNL